MKKLMLVAVMAIASLTAVAQDWYAGGSVGFWRNASDNQTAFRILPEVGYNISDKVAVGAQFGYDYSYENAVNVNLFVIDPYLRYSLFKNDNVNIFVDGGVDLGFGWAKTKGQSSTDTAVTYGIGFKPGIAYNISERLSLVAHVGFLGFQGGNDASQAPDQGGLMLDGNDLEFGVYYNF